MQLSDLTRGEEKALTAELPTGEQLAFRVVLARITGNDAQPLAEDAGPTPAKLAGLLAKCVTWWDVQAPAGEDEGGGLVDLPATADNLMAAPLPVLSAMFNAVQEANRPPGRPSGSFGTG